MAEPVKVPSPFQRASAVPSRLKAFLFGAPGTGKTLLSIQFPGPVVLDLERGTDHYGADYSFDKFPTVNLDDIYRAVEWLRTQDHEYRTLIVDPVTILWDMIQSKWVDIFGRKAQIKGAGRPDAYTFEPKDHKPMKDEFRKFLRSIYALDMNVVCTAHQRAEYSDVEFMKKIGDTFDCERGTAHAFDVVGQLRLEKGGKRMIRLLKDRTHKLPTSDFPAEFKQFEKALGKVELAKKAEPTPEPAEEKPAPVEAKTPEGEPVPVELRNEIKSLASKVGISIHDLKVRLDVEPGKPMSREACEKAVEFLRFEVAIRGNTDEAI